MKINFNKEGLTGDNLKLVEDLEKRMGDLPESVGKAELAKEVRGALKGFVNEQGETLVDPELLAELIGDDENKSIKGLRSILVKQGQAIEAMQERAAKKADENPLEAVLEKYMPEIEKRFSSRGSDKSEVKFNIRAAAVMGTTNTIDETTKSVPVEILEGMGLDNFVGKRYGQQYIYDIADRTTVSEIDEYSTWLEEGSEQGAFAIVAEGALKPLVSTALIRNYAKAKKVAGKYVITEEFAKFRRNALAIIRRLVRDKLVRDYSAIITADMVAAAVGYTGSSFDDTFAAPNDYDAIGVVAAQLAGLNFNPDVLILNPADAWRIRLTKDSQGRYQFPVVTSDGQTNIFGFTLVTTTYQAAGYFTLAESGLFKIEEEPITVRMGYGVDFTTGTQTAANTQGTVVTAAVSDFDNNRMRMIIELFFKDWLATPHAGSIVRAQFSTVKAALQA